MKYCTTLEKENKLANINICLSNGDYFLFEKDGIVKSKLVKSKMYLGPYQTSMMEFICENGYSLETANYISKKA